MAILREQRMRYGARVDAVDGNFAYVWLPAMTIRPYEMPAQPPRAPCMDPRSTSVPSRESPRDGDLGSTQPHTKTIRSRVPRPTPACAPVSRAWARIITTAGRGAGRLDGPCAQLAGRHLGGSHVVRAAHSNRMSELVAIALSQEASSKLRPASSSAMSNRAGTLPKGGFLESSTQVREQFGGPSSCEK